MDEKQAKIQREFDEASTIMVDQFPKLWRGLYQSCVREGFSHAESLQLTIAFIQKPEI